MHGTGTSGAGAGTMIPIRPVCAECGRDGKLRRTPNNKAISWRCPDCRKLLRATGQKGVYISHQEAEEYIREAEEYMASIGNSCAAMDIPLEDEEPAPSVTTSTLFDMPPEKGYKNYG